MRAGVVPGWGPHRTRAATHAVTRAREITNDAVYAETASNCGPAVGLSLQRPRPVPRGRSQLASDTCHQVSPRAVPSSERQEQSSGRLRTASIARVSSLCRFLVRPPCREHPSAIPRDRAASSPSMRPPASDLDLPITW